VYAMASAERVTGDRGRGLGTFAGRATVVLPSGTVRNHREPQRCAAQTSAREISNVVEKGKRLFTTEK